MCSGFKAFCCNDCIDYAKKKACQSWQPTRPREKERRLNKNENRRATSPSGEIQSFAYRALGPICIHAHCRRRSPASYRLQSHSLLLSASTRQNLQLISLRSNRRQFSASDNFCSRCRRYGTRYTIWAANKSLPSSALLKHNTKDKGRSARNKIKKFSLFHFCLFSVRI